MFQITCIYSKANSNFIVQNLQLQHLIKIPFDLLSFDFETSLGRRFKDAIYIMPSTSLATKNVESVNFLILQFHLHRSHFLIVIVFFYEYIHN